MVGKAAGPEREHPREANPSRALAWRAREEDVFPPFEGLAVLDRQERGIQDALSSPVRLSHVPPLLDGFGAWSSQQARARNG